MKLLDETDGDRVGIRRAHSVFDIFNGSFEHPEFLQELLSCVASCITYLGAPRILFLLASVNLSLVSSLGPHFKAIRVLMPKLRIVTFKHHIEQKGAFQE